MSTSVCVAGIHSRARPICSIGPFGPGRAAGRRGALGGGENEHGHTDTRTDAHTDERARFGHASSVSTPSSSPSSSRRRHQIKQREKATYQIAAVAASSFIVASAIVATYFRIKVHMESSHEIFPYLDLLTTCLLAVGGMVGMEMYARVVHRFAWHENEVGWKIHESHHMPRKGAFELNDVYAIMNAVPAIGLTGYGFLREDVIGGVCFGLGLGITLYGMAYMFVHDGMVHGRFAVGPVKDVPGLRRIAVAHRMHHMDDFGGYPYGMFLGPSELEKAGFGDELDRLVQKEEEMRR